MRVFDTLITDRSPNDVAYLQGLYKKGWGNLTGAEKDWLLNGEISPETGDATGVHKGAYGNADLNRVTEAINALKTRLAAVGYSTGYTQAPISANWAVGDVPTKDQMAQYLSNIQGLRNCFPYAAPDAPASMDGLTIQTANDIEEILLTLDRVLISMQEGFQLRQANTIFMVAGGVLNHA